MGNELECFRVLVPKLDRRRIKVSSKQAEQGLKLRAIFRVRVRRWHN